MANTAWYAGKGYAMRGIRSPGSPCFDSLLYLTHEQAAPIRAAKQGELFPAHLNTFPCLMFGALSMTAGTVTAVVNGWDLWPQWACASILVTIIAEFVVGQIIDIPMGTTDLFLRSAEALVVACETLEVVQYLPPSEPLNGALKKADDTPQRHQVDQRVDWVATYGNFDALCSLVEDVSRGWRLYFFAVEFCCVPSLGMVS
mmetsp:Transcript_46600/g.129934  ORF Transcript_46600/g.129934 Transcript_46600/m.129934 type:complete len:201 (-) Transcript_46600:159-761(-)